MRGEGTRKEDKNRVPFMGAPNEGDFMSDMSKSQMSSKRSINSRRTEMSLEEKLLNGFYKVPTDGVNK